MTRFVLLLLLLTTLGCERLELTPEPEVDAGVLVDGGTSRPRFVTTAFDGGFLTIAQATDEVNFIAFDLDHAEEAPFVDEKWDLAFRRQRVRLRGGANGDGGVAAVPLVDAGFSEVTTAPDAGYLVDLPDGPDDNTEPDTVFENAETWYSYNPMTHVLTPRPIVYVVKSDEGQFFKVSLGAYYDKAGTPAVLELRWAKVMAP